MTAACLSDGRVPLVLVAAPGGGGKAAYWTAAAMDQLFGQQGFCPGSLFAASGVSGGAVGLVTRLAVRPAEPSERFPQPLDDSASEQDQDAVNTYLAEPAQAAMTEEGPLAEAMAALMLRDIPQPLTAVRSGWRDRAAVMEDAWARAADGTFDADGDGSDDDKTFEDLGAGWWKGDDEGGPVILLGGTSATNGCRSLVANVSGLPASSPRLSDRTRESGPRRNGRGHRRGRCPHRVVAVDRI